MNKSFGKLLLLKRNEDFVYYYYVYLCICMATDRNLILLAGAIALYYCA